MTTWPVVFLFIAGVVVLAAFAGHRLTYLRMRMNARQIDRLAAAAEQIVVWRQTETVASAWGLSMHVDRTADMLEGLKKCYYAPPDLERVTWVSRDVPTPFVGFAPEPGHFSTCVINNMQFRYAREIDVPKPRNVCRIFVTGGSTAYSPGATSNDTTIGGYLEKYLNATLLDRAVRCEVVTAAACGWSSTHERILIENRLVELEPDLVISFSGHNDAFWSSGGRNVLWTRGFQDDYFFLLANTAVACNSATEFPSGDPGAGALVPFPQSAGRLARNVVLAHHALATVGADYVFALQPAMEVSQKTRTPREQRVATAVSSQGWFVQMESFYQVFRKSLLAIDQPGFHFVDTTPVFDSCGDDVDVFMDTAHFGDRGNDLIAQNLCSHVLPIIKKRL